MGFFKAIGRACAKAVSRRVERKQVAGASSKAYEQTGKDIVLAKKRGQYINGSERYKSYKNDAIRQARQKGNDREKFIDDLF